MEANFKIDQQLVKTVGWVAKIDFDIAKKKIKQQFRYICSMYRICTYLRLIFMVNVGKYSIHGSYGNYCMFLLEFQCVAEGK